MKASQRVNTNLWYVLKESEAARLVRQFKHTLPSIIIASRSDGVYVYEYTQPETRHNKYWITRRDTGESLDITCNVTLREAIEMADFQWPPNGQ